MNAIIKEYIGQRGDLKGELGKFTQDSGEASGWNHCIH